MINLDFDVELKLMNHYDVDYEHLVFIKCMLHMRNYADVGYFSQYYGKRPLRSDIIDNLVSKKIVKTAKFYRKGDPFDPSLFELTEQFTKNFYKLSGQYGKELKDAFPPFMDMLNYRYPTCNLKSYATLEDFYNDYAKAIRHNPQQHQLVLASIRKAVNMNIVSCTLEDFVKTRQWEVWGRLEDVGEYDQLDLVD